MMILTLFPLQSLKPTQAVLPRTFRTCSTQKAEKPTGSEANVHAEKHDASPEELQKKTANKAQSDHHTTGTAAANDKPTHSEDFVQADKHDHDPLPDHKKASKNKN